MSILYFPFRHVAMVGAYHWQITEASNVLGITSICVNSAPCGLTAGIIKCFPASLV